MKITLSRILETSKFLATDAGKQLEDFIIYISNLADITLRALRNGITFEDNVNCEILEPSLNHNVEQVITTSRAPVGIIPIKVSATASENNGLTGFIWYQNTKGETVVKASIAGSPTVPVGVKLIILFK